MLTYRADMFLLHQLIFLKISMSHAKKGGRSRIMLSFLPVNMILSFPIPIQLGYIVLSFVVAVMGRHRKMGFWGYLFCSILFSPVLGVMMVLVSEKKRQHSS